jgi:putative endopeptidase
MTMTRRQATFGAVAGAAAAGAASEARAALAAKLGLDLASMDRSVKPGDDFFRYVNGKWLAETKIPPDRGRWTEFNRLDDLNAERNRAILEAAASAPSTPELRKVGDLYASLMDEAGTEARGIRPLQPELARIAAIATPADLAGAIAQLSWDWLHPLPGGASPMPPSPIAASVSIDYKNPRRYLPDLEQGGLGLPDRDYYFDQGAAFARAREAYRAHLVAMFRLAGLTEPEARAARTYALEQRIARSHWTRAAMRQVDRHYNLFTRAQLKAKAPGLDWDVFLDAAGFNGRDLFMVEEPDATAGVAEAARGVPLQDWRDYLAYRVIRAFAPVGPKAFVAENFAFEDKALNGTPELAPAWKRAGVLVDRAMGHAVGRVYLAKYFPPAAQAQARAMTGAIIAAMGRRISNLAWMTPKTKARALAKLKNVRVEVGGQEPLRTYERLTVARDDPFGNLLRAAHVEYRRDLDKLGRPVDRGEWSMVPQTVNAQSSPLMTKIMFPAGIMQGLFFDAETDPAVNYGAIGVVIGHELSHQFDDQGAKYDETGALNNWWTPEDLRRFQAATDALAKQYDAYEPLPGLHINGRLTLGENIADLAGLLVARDAYLASLGGRPAPVIDGFTGDQRFYQSFAQVYRSLSREGYMRQAVATDPHSPGEWRAAEVRNCDPWYAAFDVRPGQKMYLPPDRRVRIW